MLGETNRTLVLAHARSSDSGDYAVLVGNLAGAVRSKEATVSVSDRAVVYWGSNLAGLTNGTLGLTNVVAVAAGRSHALALQADCKVLAWGANAFQTNVPSDLSNVVAISAGGFHSLALKEYAQEALCRIKRPDYYYIIRSAPIEDSEVKYHHWYLVIVPKLTTPAGFEIGTGIYINTTLPEQCAEFVRGITIP